MRRHLWIAVAVIVIISVTGVAGAKKIPRPAPVPHYEPVQKTVWLSQHWSASDRNWFHHVDQGTQTFGIPYEWFMALEQPELSLMASPLLSDASYLDRYGFIADGTSLPIGFAHGGQIRTKNGTVWLNPQTKQPMERVGLTCAACHTGRLTFRDTAILVAGGPAITNVPAFQQNVGIALIYTRYVPFRFGRFADRVLTPDATEEGRSALHQQLDEVVSTLFKVAALEKAVASQGVEEGFGRLDALNRIGNTLFALDTGIDQNYVGSSAPVHYPRIWDSPWFEWVQYNGSIEQPMVRNAGEALGVMSWLDMQGEKQNAFSSSVQARALFEMEQLLAGKQPDAEHGFSGLVSPQWPADVLPPIDRSRADKGAALYKEMCQSCHLPPVGSPGFWTSDRWLPPNETGERYLDLELVDINHVGTDPHQAADMSGRHVALPPRFGIRNTEFGRALGELVRLTMNRWYDDQQPPTPAEARDEMNGHRPDGIQAPLGYKVRPLTGIWAAPPYLHNGSVPNLYALLSPVEERPKRFWLGRREYDPIHVGYSTEEISGGFELDTTLPGNSNGGHEFNSVQGKKGVIGRLLTPDERLAMIEYLKTL